eukprot:scaffold33002_cov32-Tisochrysis_lutea.AAC.3
MDWAASRATRWRARNFGAQLKCRSPFRQRKRGDVLCHKQSECREGLDASAIHKGEGARAIASRHFCNLEAYIEHLP